MDAQRAAKLLLKHGHRFSPEFYEKGRQYVISLASSEGGTIGLAQEEPRYKRFVENRHRRGYGGKFAAKQSTTITPQNLEMAMNRLQEGEYIDIPGGKGKVKRLKTGFQVVAGNGTLNKVFKDLSDALDSAQRVARGRVGKRAGTKDTTKYGGS
jgi:hypothetical protein